MSSETPQRILALWCPDWPVVAAGIPPDEPGVVLHANRVVASSEAARSVGVVRGLRRREAQSRCPELELSERDLAAEARSFEAIAAAIEVFTPRVEVLQPGTAIFPVRGPSRYFGGDDALAEKMLVAIRSALEGRTTCHIGIADGVFTARVAARMRSESGEDRGHLVPPGKSPEFLAGLPITTLDQRDLTDILWRLGLRTLGDFAALDPKDVMGRFAREGLTAHRRASGLDERLADVVDPPPEMAVSLSLEPPLERIDQAAFVARQLALELEEKLARRGAACTRIAIEAESEHGENYVRHWRHEGALSVSAVTDRVRWQLDSWLNASPNVRPSGGLSVLTLSPEDLIPAGGRQLGFWGGESEADLRAGRAVARLEALVGAENVKVAQWKGGREPSDKVQLLPASTVDLTDRQLSVFGDQPWPGQLPAPSPVELFAHTEIEVIDECGMTVTVSGRGELSAPPAHMRRHLTKSRGNTRERDWVNVVAWAGPWLLDERWWDPQRARRRARFQLVTSDGEAVLVFVQEGKWWLAGTY